jgi:hypothetical protein
MVSDATNEEIEKLAVSIASLQQKSGKEDAP